jgi:hypothetical protein
MTCLPAELGLLARLLGAETLIGVPNPFQGWMPDEIEAALAKAQQRLFGRGILMVEGDQLLINPGVALLLASCLLAPAVFVQTYTRAGGAPTERYYYANDKICAEMNIRRRPDVVCDLSAHRNPVALFQRTIEVFRVAEQAAPAAPGGILAQQALARARAAAVDAGAAEAAVCLIDAGLDGVTATALAQTLAHPIANGSFVALRRPDQAWETEGLSLLEGTNGLWSLRSRVGEHLVEVRPCTGQSAHLALRAAFNWALPVSLHM